MKQHLTRKAESKCSEYKHVEQSSQQMPAFRLGLQKVLRYLCLYFVSVFSLNALRMLENVRSSMLISLYRYWRSSCCLYNRYWSPIHFIIIMIHCYLCSYQETDSKCSYNGCWVIRHPWRSTLSMCSSVNIKSQLMSGK